MGKRGLDFAGCSLSGTIQRPLIAHGTSVGSRLLLLRGILVYLLAQLVADAQEIVHQTFVRSERVLF